MANLGDNRLNFLRAPHLNVECFVQLDQQMRKFPVLRVSPKYGLSAAVARNKPSRSRFNPVRITNKLQPGTDGVCLEPRCCWRDFCSAYQSQAVPLDGYLSPMPSQGDLAKFTDFLLARGPQSPGLRIPGLGVTVRAQAALEPLSRKLVIGSPHSTICESSDSSNILRPVRLAFNVGVF